jgi:uncharacterized membrane protein
MRLRRLLRHAAALHWRTRVMFPRTTLDAIREAIERAERAHAGEIRFAIETALAPHRVIGEVAPRARALEVFSELRVWDTEHNNGVLIYVLVADRSVEIVADRGLGARVSQADWEGVCRMMEEHYRAGRIKAGSIAGIDAVGGLLARHFPAAIPNPPAARNELSDQPTLL